MEEKKRWNAAFEEHMRACDERKPVIWAGDLNVVLDERGEPLCLLCPAKYCLVGAHAVLMFSIPPFFARFHSN